VPSAGLPDQYWRKLRAIVEFHGIPCLCRRMRNYSDPVASWHAARAVILEFSPRIPLAIFRACLARLWNYTEWRVLTTFFPGLLAFSPRRLP